MTRPDWLPAGIPDATWERVRFQHIDNPVALVDYLIKQGWLIGRDEHDRRTDHLTRGAKIFAEARADKAEQQMRDLREAIPEAVRRNARRVEAVRALVRRDRKTLPMAALRDALDISGEA